MKSERDFPVRRHRRRVARPWPQCKAVRDEDVARQEDVKPRVDLARGEDDVAARERVRRVQRGQQVAQAVRLHGQVGAVKRLLGVVGAPPRRFFKGARPRGRIPAARHRGRRRAVVPRLALQRLCALAGVERVHHLGHLAQAELLTAELRDALDVGRGDDAVAVEVEYVHGGAPRPDLRRALSGLAEQRGVRVAEHDCEEKGLEAPSAAVELSQGVDGFCRQCRVDLARLAARRLWIAYPGVREHLGGARARVRVR
mmetsp:Transcript_26468/g.89048  ORF Transcript_26468/g.89048 Transcript_26468/m.89048 type:complete len:256 (-) Transcript_26468:500-1267(-)